uniref:Uncharacterized protein n=1 Tax=Rhizophora mucronata TaxID=61149 RepID=A0A2P2MLW0_RHIMU
MPSFISGLLYE